MPGTGASCAGEPPRCAIGRSAARPGADRPDTRRGALQSGDSPMRYPDQEGKSAMAEKKTEVYSAEYMGSGTFRISKPKRKPSKLKEIRSKRSRRRARRN